MIIIIALLLVLFLHLCHYCSFLDTYVFGQTAFDFEHESFQYNNHILTISHNHFHSPNVALIQSRNMSSHKRLSVLSHWFSILKIRTLNFYCDKEEDRGAVGGVAAEKEEATNMKTDMETMWKDRQLFVWWHISRLYEVDIGWMKVIMAND